VSADDIPVGDRIVDLGGIVVVLERRHWPLAALMERLPGDQEAPLRVGALSAERPRLTMHPYHPRPR